MDGEKWKKKTWEAVDLWENILEEVASQQCSHQHQQCSHQHPRQCWLTTG